MKKILCAALLLAPLFAQAEAVGCNTVGDKAPATFLATDHADEIVHIRARPNTRAGIVVSCDNQSEVSMLGKTGAWYRVRTTLWGNAGNSSRTITGYVHQSQVSLRHTFTVQAPEGFVYFRDGADARAPVQEKLNNGTMVTEYPRYRQGNWLHVSIPGDAGDVFGYVHKSGLRPVE